VPTRRAIRSLESARAALRLPWWLAALTVACIGPGGGGGGSGGSGGADAPGADGGGAEVAADASAGDAATRGDLGSGDAPAADLGGSDAARADATISDTGPADAQPPDVSQADVQPIDAGGGDAAGSCSANTACPKGAYCASAIGVCGGGVCAPMPLGCPDVEMPVCGCNGKTYGNACDAAAAGVTVKANGACAPNPKVCGGPTAAKCPSKSEMCDLQGCGPGAPGLCVPWLPSCPPVNAVVCGCDGKTYESDCARVKAGIGKASDGACQPGPGACSTSNPASCPGGSFCSVPAGVCQGNGACAPKPEVCNMLYKPVCGCNGITYGNSCAAMAAGQNITAQGECGAQPPKYCGGKQGIPCLAGEVCDPSQCGADVTGACKPAPKAPCPKTTPDAQQCGCDGVTYANECLRLTAKVGKKSDGPCPGGGGQPCVNLGGVASCPAGEFCKSPDGMCAMAGLCTKVPPACNMMYAPVCGCDGKTYGNACSADAAQISIKGNGECSGSCGADSDCPFGESCQNGVCASCAVPCPAIPCPPGSKMDPCTCKCVMVPPPPP